MAPGARPAHYNGVVGTKSLESLFSRYATTGDEAASRELVARTRSRLLAAARRIGNAADAEDSVQTAYLSLLHKRDEAFEAPILPWLMTATVRIAYRAKAKRERLLVIAGQLAQTAPVLASDDTVADAEDARLLRTRVADLPALLRDPVVLHYFQGLSTGEVGQLLGATPNAVKKRLQRARAILRMRLHPRLTAGLLALPWWLADHASAALLGGIAMKKTATVVTLLLVLAAATGGIMWRAQSRNSAAAPARAAAARPRTVAPEQEPEEPDIKPREPLVRRGVVVYPDGTPAAGARVWKSAYHWKGGQRMAFAHWQELISTRADADGRFDLDQARFERLEWIEYSAHAPGYAWSFARARPGKAPRIVLAKGATLKLSARGPDGALPDNALFVISREYPEITIGGGFQEFMMAIGAEATFDLPSARYKVRVVAPGLTPLVTMPFVLEVGEQRAFDFELLRGVVYAIEVIDADGEPAPGVVVRAEGPGGYNAEVTTDAAGRCTVSGIVRPESVGERQNRGVRFRIEQPGVLPIHTFERVPRNDGEYTRKLRLQRGKPVVFRFRNKRAAPLVDQQVYFSYRPPGQSAISWYRNTNAKGEISFDALAAAAMFVTIQKIDKRAREFALDGTAQTIDISLAPGDLELAGEVRLPEGSPAVGGSVAFTTSQSGPGGSKRAPVATDGTFRIVDLEAGEGLIWVWAPGFVAQSFPARVPGSAFVVQLAEGKAVAGVVRERDGTPRAGLPVKLETNINGWVELGVSVSDDAGRFSFRGVTQDNVQIRAQNEEWIESHGLGLAVRPGDTAFVVTVKPRAEGFGLHVPIELRDTRGKPVVADFVLRYTLDGERGRWGLQPRRTETPGRYELKYFDRPGRCDFTFEIAGYRPRTLRGIDIVDSAEQTPIVVELDPGATLTVTALDAGGAPIVGKILRAGSVSARTDAGGRAVFGGFEPGEREVTVLMDGDLYYRSARRMIRLPGVMTATLRRRGQVHLKTTGSPPFRWKLVDADGRTQDEYESKWKSALLSSPRAGPHRVIVEHASGRAEYAVDIRLGERGSVSTPK